MHSFPTRRSSDLLIILFECQAQPNLWNSICFIKESWDGRIRTFAITGQKPVALPLGDAPFFIFKTNINLILNYFLIILFECQAQPNLWNSIGVVLAYNQKNLS